MAMKLYLILSLLFGMDCQLSAAEQAPAPPDLTHGGRRDDTHYWLLGATGACCWIFTRNDELTAESGRYFNTP